MNTTKKTDLEKVIKGLELCSREPGQTIGCLLDCPYDNVDGCKRKLMRYALALLKAQESRVMTLEEVITSKPGTVVWLEDFDKPDVISGLFKRLFIYTKVIDFLIVKEEVSNEVTADLDVYGSEWRCWTSRTTEAEREAIPWN